MRLIGACLAGIVAAGCYYYRPVSTTPPPATFVSVALTDSGTQRLWRYLGPDVGNVRGRLVAADDTALTLSVDAVEMRNGTSLGWKGERAVVNRQLVQELSDRHFSIGRTTLAGGLSAAAFFLTVQAFKVLGGGGSGGGGGGKPR
ncbi:MAG: hypothetical protein ABR537_14000 [Gemmatimonadales bacterium]